MRQDVLAFKFVILFCLGLYWLFLVIVFVVEYPGACAAQTNLVMNSF